MAWNTPGNDQKKPGWGPQKTNNGPPDIEAMLRKLLSRGKKPAGQKTEGHKPMQSSLIAGGVLVVLVGLWAISGLYSVDSSEQAVVLIGGQAEVVSSGLHWYPRFFANKVIVNTAVQTLNFSHVLPLGSKGAVGLSLVMKYQIEDPKQYVLATTNSALTLEQGLVSATYAAVATAQNAQEVTAAAVLIKDKLNQTVQHDQLGLTVLNIDISIENVPDAVQQAMKSMQQLETDNSQALSQAENAASQAQAQANAEAEQIKSAAQAYSQAVVLEAQTKTVAFKSALAQYQSAPEVTATRLYFDTMQKLFSTHALIVSDADVLYLPSPTSAVPLAPSQAGAPAVATPPLKNNAVAAPSQANTGNQAMSDYTRWEEAQ